MRFKISSKHNQTIRNIVCDLLDGVIEAGPVDINIPDVITIDVTRHDDHLAFEWSENPEIDIPGLPSPFDPDMIRAEIHETHAIIDLILGNVRIDF